MLSQKQRFPLRQHTDFFRNASRKPFSSGVLYFRVNEAQSFQGAVVVKKTVGGAVIRNSLKRLGRKVLKEFSEQQKTGVFVIVFHHLPKTSAMEFELEIKHTLSGIVDG